MRQTSFRRRALAAAGLTAVAALTLSACGTTDDAATDKKSSSGEKITATTPTCLRPIIFGSAVHIRKAATSLAISASVAGWPSA